ncbi:hypothetical protein D3C76_1667450 [compost metagenome]
MNTWNNDILPMGELLLEFFGISSLFLIVELVHNGIVKLIIHCIKVHEGCKLGLTFH